jgi:hypothetical protein
MDVHAGLTELSELNAFLRAFQVRCRWAEGTTVRA